MACPFLLSSQGVTIGFTGDPASPIVEASGIPRSMWVAWFSPSDSLSRMTAQDASFEITAVTPNFLKKPSSCAITIDAQSVKAMMPKRTVGVSGESSAYTGPGPPAGQARHQPADGRAGGLQKSSSRCLVHRSLSPRAGPKGPALSLKSSARRLALSQKHVRRHEIPVAVALSWCGFLEESLPGRCARSRPTPEAAATRRVVSCTSIS